MDALDDLPFVKGHGTENDFVLLPDANGRLDLTTEQVAAICDRRAGIGADGVIRVVRTDATDDPAAVAARGEAVWFMDYRNHDGSVSEMCGNGVRVLGLYLATHADVDVRGPLPVATRAGVRMLGFDSGPEGLLVTVDMGAPQVLEETWVRVGDRQWVARHVSMGNPHAVAFLHEHEDLDGLGPLHEPPAFDTAVFPDGVNVELVSRRGEHHVAMRVHERGSGETRSCGTGACAVAVMTAVYDDAPRGTPHRIDLPGGTLTVTWTDEGDDGGRVLLTGPATLVAEGVLSI